MMAALKGHLPLARKLIEDNKDKVHAMAKALLEWETIDSEQLDDIARAKAFCGECPVKEACFEAALVRREPYGVWGGRLFFKGKVLAVKRPRGRPPKNPRPEVAMNPEQETLIA